MRAGALRNVIEIQEQSTTRDSFGALPQTWTTIKRLKCAIDTPNAREIYRNDRAFPLEVYTFRCRFVRGVDTTMRVKHGDEHYSISNVIDPGAMKRETHIIATRIGITSQIGRA